MAGTLETMTPLRFLFRLVFASSLLFLALRSNASPTTPQNHNSLAMLNSSFDEIISHCYTPEGQETRGVLPVDLKHCEDALAILVRTEDFTTRFRFSKNPRAMAISIPIGWQKGTDATCRIIVNCENDRDTGVFRYADIAQSARRIIQNCVNKPDPLERYPLLKWGGIDGIRGEETFYVALARPIRRELEVKVANGTLVADGGLVDGEFELRDRFVRGAQEIKPTVIVSDLSLL